MHHSGTVTARRSSQNQSICFTTIVDDKGNDSADNEIVSLSAARPMAKSMDAHGDMAEPHEVESLPCELDTKTIFPSTMIGINNKNRNSKKRPDIFSAFFAFGLSECRSNN